MPKQINTILGFVLIIGLAFLAVAGILFINSFVSSLFGGEGLSWYRTARFSPPALKEFKKFTSEQEFQDYVEKAQQSFPSGFAGAMLKGVPDETVFAQREQTGLRVPTAPPSAGTVPSRVSETNVQVAGIDEPDIVKTNGKEIYFSKYQYYYLRNSMPISSPSVLEEDYIIPPQYQGGVKIIKAFPPSDLALNVTIEDSGNLLLQDNILVVFSQDGQKIQGYDVSDPKNPNKKWTYEIDSKTTLLDARLKEGKIYLVLRQDIDQRKPCPIKPLTLNGKDLELSCLDVYHPTIIVPTDVTFTAFAIDVVSGKAENKIAFVGSSSHSLIYMSNNNLYAAYSYESNPVDFFYNFLEEDGKNLLPDWVKTKIRKLLDYDISQEAKVMELGLILDDFQNSLNEDEALKLQNELTDKMASYLARHIKNLEKTGIVRLSLANFAIQAVGNVPGKPLNQFSLDEEQDYLRIAVTVGGRGSSFSGASESLNDVYVLDKKLKIVGSVEDLGKGERIYSARFVGNKGYVVTFKETDPFYVLDLSNPEKPEKKGELKIPGYSSYLHPITQDKILGIGKEGSQVKVSLFDVKDPSNPKEIDKYTLDEYWSDILNTHHAFLLDTKHNIFFLPGSRGAYIFSYENDDLTMKKAIAESQVKRALYIDDYLYLVSEENITVLNELSWEQVKELEL